MRKIRKRVGAIDFLIKLILEFEEKKKKLKNSTDPNNE